MTVRITYQSPNYRPHLVAKRYVRFIGGNLYHVYECAAKQTASNRDKRLTRFGAGPTIREYHCGLTDVPQRVVDKLNGARIVEWIS